MRTALYLIAFSILIHSKVDLSEIISTLKGLAIWFFALDLLDVFDIIHRRDK